MDIFAHVTLLTDITRVASCTEALVRVYKERVVLNAAARKLLGLKDDSKVSFRTADNGPDGTRKVYVARKQYAAYGLHRKGNGYSINSTALCKALSDALQGYGTYRIEGENRIVDYNGDVCYQVFYRKFE